MEVISCWILPNILNYSHVRNDFGFHSAIQIFYGHVRNDSWHSLVNKTQQKVKPQSWKVFSQGHIAWILFILHFLSGRPPPIRVGAILLWSHKNLTRARVATRKGMHGINGILRFVNHSLVMWINSNTSGPYEFQYSYGGWPRKKKYIYFLKKKKKIQKKHILIDFRQKIASLDWLWATPPPNYCLMSKQKCNIFI